MTSLNRIYSISCIGILLFFLFAYHSVFSQPTTPKFQSFQPITPQKSNTEQPIFLPGYNSPILQNNPIEQQNRQILQQSVMTLPGPTNNNQKQRAAELKQILQEEENNNSDYRKIEWSKAYANKFKEFLQMNPASFSLTKAVYLAESAWYDNPPEFAEFETGIRQMSNFVKEMLRREGLPSNNNTAINYGIQQLYRRTDKAPLLSYDFNDYLGEKNWNNMFVTKLLQNGKGQCHSMPLLYLCLAEQLHGKAWLSLAPNHSYVQFFDNQGNRHHFECTSGNLVTQSLLMQSTFVTATAIKNNTYLDTLSSQQLYAQCLSDLLLGYINKIGYDQHTDQITEQILKVDPKNIVALMTQANLNTWKAIQKRKEAGNPDLSQIANYPAVNALYQARDASYRRVDATGFQNMPKELYEQWLKSIEQEKNKEASKVEQEKMNQEMERLKKIKPTIINKPKG